MIKYPKYKETEVIWVKSLPDNWELLRVKYFSIFRNGYSFKGTDFYDDEKYPVVRIGDIQDGKVNLSEAKKVSKDIYEEAKKFSNKKGDILLALTGATIGKSAIYDTDEISLLNQRVAALRPNKKANIDFLKYLIEAPEFKTLIDFECYGGAQENIGKGQITSAKFPIPSLPEQHTIVRFLDYKTGQIDSFIANRQKQIELLKEQKAGIINKAVTKGINPNAKMKDSGIEWIGKIPSHWEIWKVSRLFKKIGSGTTPKAGTPAYYENGTIPWVNTGDLNDSILESCETFITEKAFDDHSTLKIYSKGTLLIAMYGATIAKLSILNFDACTNQACCALANSKLIEIDFAFNWFLSQKQNIINLSYGGGQPNISQDVVRSIRIPLPPSKEQKEIIDFIKEETSNVVNLISKYQKQIDLMQEYRTSLISQTVTGKIDVREWQPKKQRTA